jgi:hypothetical protein
MTISLYLSFLVVIIYYNVKKTCVNNFFFLLKGIRTFITIVNKVSKETTLQYTVTLIDDLLQENKMRVDLFHMYSRKYKENVYQTFLRMLTLQDVFLKHQVARIITKLACWSAELMPDKDLRDFIYWAKENLDEKVRIFFFL